MILETCPLCKTVETELQTIQCSHPACYDCWNSSVVCTTCSHPIPPNFPVMSHVEDRFIRMFVESKTQTFLSDTKMIMFVEDLKYFKKYFINLPNTRMLIVVNSTRSLRLDTRTLVDVFPNINKLHIVNVANVDLEPLQFLHNLTELRVGEKVLYLPSSGDTESG
jgi:hypothetical protein